jgi:Tfp pilus assembly protein PilF
MEHIGRSTRINHDSSCYDVHVKIAAGFLLAGLCAAAESGYIDSGQCAECHAKIAQTYARTGMARSFHRAVDAGTVEDFFHAPSNTHFAMIVRGRQSFQRRWQVDSKGRAVNVDEKSIDFVMGSGNHVRTFLHRTAAGTLQQLPLAWYADPGEHWAMNPGYDTPDQPNSRRTIGYECMSCHNAYPEIPAGQDQLRAEPVFSGPLPEGIDCQRCHGPGARHVELARAGKAAGRAIVNPRRLAPARQMDVCAQCHFETTSFPLPHAIVKYQRGAFSFRPGERLNDFTLFFDTSRPDPDRFQIVSSVYRLKMSACFLKSSGKLQCTTCHDPHGESRAANAACGTCHAVARDMKHPAGPDCVACHMPKRRTDDVVHAVMTDHYIQRRRPDRDLLASKREPHGPAIVYHGEVKPYDPDGFENSPENKLYLALAQVREGSNLKPGINQLKTALQKYQPAESEFYVELGDALVKDGRPAEAVPFYRRGAAKKPDSLAAALGLGNALEQAGDLEGAARAFAGANDSAKGKGSEALRRLGEVRIKQHRAAEARDALEKSLELDQESPETHYALATVLDGERAEAEYREAIRLQPDYSAAHMNLAIMLFRGNRPEEAREHFEWSLRSHPEYALGHYNYGLMLLAQGLASAAREQMKLALQGSDALDTRSRQDAIRRLAELDK